MSKYEYGAVTNGAEHHVGFYLANHFGMLPFIAALEPLRIANRFARKPLYQWSVVTSDGGEVIASNGMPQSSDCSVADVIAKKVGFSMIFVSGPFKPDEFDDDAALLWLRQQGERGILIGGIETGSHILARAGLLAGRQCTTHWENQAQLSDHSGLQVSSDVFEVDGNRLTCSGGAASLDMMLYLIEQQHNHELATSVADCLIHPHIRNGGEPQRMNLQARTGVFHPELLECIALMESNIEQPLTPNELADLIGVSQRQLERLFQRYLRSTPARYYLALRLESARQMIEKSSLKIIDVALACGFKSAGHFSRRYSSNFGNTPRQTRKTVREAFHV